MKTSLHRALLAAGLSVAASVPCSITAQTPAPAPATGTDRNANTTSTANQPASGAATNQTQTVAPNTTTTPSGTAGTGTSRTTATQSVPGASSGAATTTTAGRNAATTTPGAVTTRNTATALPNGTISTSGTIDSFGANNFSLQAGAGGAASDFLIGDSTAFVDLAGNPVPRERFFRRGGRVPATVFYNRAPNGGLIADRVVLNESIVNTPIETAGTITEVSPGILVIEQPGASDTPVRYVNNKTTNYVNENGEPVPPESVKPGTPVKIFYTKVGDTLVASRVEVGRKGASGLPKPAVQVEKSTTTTKSVKEIDK
jgi:hypothetical protein